VSNFAHRIFQVLQKGPIYKLLAEDEVGLLDNKNSLNLGRYITTSEEREGKLRRSLFSSNTAEEIQLINLASGYGKPWIFSPDVIGD
jgi:hypothetical protein